MLSDRSDIIVMTDEAHRSQYDTLRPEHAQRPAQRRLHRLHRHAAHRRARRRPARSSATTSASTTSSSRSTTAPPCRSTTRTASPSCSSPTRTSTRTWSDLLEEAELDEAQEKKLEREFAREYHLITRDDRLETIAEDIVAHFMGRGYQGKAMVVSIDKATAVRMYDKVQKHWQRAPRGPAGRAGSVPSDEERADLGDEDRLHGRDRHGRGRLAVAERDRGPAEEGRWTSGRTASAWSTRTWTTKFKDPDDPLRHRLRLRHVDDRLRRAVAARPSTSTSRCGTTR